MKTAHTISVYLDSARGIYIPQSFAKQTRKDCVENVSTEDWDALLAGPDGEFYWDVWQDVLDNAILTEPESGLRFKLWNGESGDIFLVPADWDWDEDLNAFAPPEGETLLRFNLPDYWASYLINGDASGLEDEDKEACDAWFERELGAGWGCVDVSENTWFTKYPDSGGLACNVARYTFTKHQ